MNCLSVAIKQTYDNAYSHHIQRLMITGNFALISGLNPYQVHQWYLAVYADAFDWVEVPNTIGMALHADGGIMASKPYAASARYISKMSNFCNSCKFDSEKTIGENACPFNSLYWHFMHQNESKLKTNQRLKFVYPTWYKMTEIKREQILKTAKNYLIKLEQNQL